MDLKGLHQIPNSPFARHLLGLSDAAIQEVQSQDALPVAVILGIAATIAIILVVAVCVCGDSSSSAELKNVQRRPPSVNNFATQAVPANSHEVTVDIPPQTQPSTVGNGTPGNRNSAAAASSHSRQASSSSSQLRPTSLRELPDPPVNSSRPQSAETSGPSGKNTSPDFGEEEDDYDHLRQTKKKRNTATNYDHINLQTPTDISEATSTSGTNTPSESYYAQVRDRTYDTVKDAQNPDYDHYTTVTDDPYANVKDDPYSKVKNEPEDTEQGEEDDPYCKVREVDPYTKVKDDDPGTVSAFNDDTSELEDPYSTVSDASEQTQVKVVSVINVRSSGNHTITERTSIGPAGSSRHSNPLPPPPQEATFHVTNGSNDDYAVVNKARNVNNGSEQQDDSDSVDPYVIPPEPPRGYNAEEAMSGATARSPQVTTRHSQPQEEGESNSSERPYTKVTARESLASMTARNALHPYEIVPEMENMYATVEGGSGDGVVQRLHITPHQESRLSQASETYAEIGATAGYGGGDTAPAPPSVDSLHLMTRHSHDDRVRSGGSPEEPGTGHAPANSNMAVNKAHNFSPNATALPEIPVEHATAGAVLVNGTFDEGDYEITLDPNYHLVKDSVVDELENDPNYESVEEARSKVRQSRSYRHEYEEVPISPSHPPEPEPSEAQSIRERVLQQHMYEAIPEVKAKQREIERKSDGNGKV